MDYLSIRRLSGAFGTEIQDIDVSGPLGDGTIAALRDALADHCTLLFCDQTLTRRSTSPSPSG